MLGIVWATQRYQVPRPATHTPASTSSRDRRTYAARSRVRSLLEVEGDGDAADGAVSATGRPWRMLSSMRPSSARPRSPSASLEAKAH